MSKESEGRGPVDLNQPNLPEEELAMVEVEDQIEQPEDPETLVAALRHREREHQEATRGLLSALAERTGKYTKRMLLVLSLLAAQERSTDLAADAMHPPEVLTAPEQEQSPEEQIQEEIRMFHDELALYKGMGRELKLFRGGYAAGVSRIRVGQGSENVQDRLLKELNANSKREGLWFMAEVQNPLEQLESSYSIQKEISPELRPSHGSISPAPLSVEVGPTDHDSTTQTIRLINWFDREHPVLYQALIEGGRLPEEQFGQLRQAVEQAFGRWPEFEQALARIQADPHSTEYLRPTFTLSTHELNPDQRKVLDQIMASVDQVSISAVASGQEVDRTRWMNTVDILPDTYPRTEGRRLSVDGQVKEITIKMPERSVHYDFDQDLVDGQPKVRMIRDRYGNFLEVFEDIILGGDGTYASNLTEIVSPPIVFSRNKADHGRFAPIRFSLAPLGLPSVEGFIEQRIETPLEVRGPNKAYGIYSNMPHQDVRDLYGFTFQEMVVGTQRAEQLFGFPEGSKVGNIYIVNSQRPNAYARAKDPKTIALQDELLEDHAQAVARTSFHETMHVIDFACGISSTALKELYRQLRVKPNAFLQELSESNFLPGGWGGHAWENELEFFASFMNSLTHEQWDQAMSDKQPEFQKMYLQTLKTLQAHLSQNKKIPAQAPIHQVLQEKVDWFTHSSK